MRAINVAACRSFLTGAACRDGCGTVFEIAPSGTLTTLYSFCSQSECADGERPWAGLVQAANGDLYGTTSEGGAYIDSCAPRAGCGTVFKIALSGALTTLHSFCSHSGCADGRSPQAALVQATDGDLYGTTVSGGAHEEGTVFEITPSGTLTILYNFCSQSACPHGENPWAGLVQATNGVLYGTTYGGGHSHSGNGSHGHYQRQFQRNTGRLRYRRGHRNHNHRTSRGDHRPDPGTHARRCAPQQRPLPGAALSREPESV